MWNQQGNYIMYLVHTFNNCNLLWKKEDTIKYFGEWKDPLMAHTKTCRLGTASEYYSTKTIQQKQTFRFSQR